MSLGKATVENLNLGQGEIQGIEKIALFVGTSEKGQTDVEALGQQTNLEEVFGSKETGTLVKQIEAARLNGGQDWMAYGIGLSASANWTTVVDTVMESVSVEYIVITDPITQKQDLLDLQEKATKLLGTKSRRTFFVCCIDGIQSGQSWGAYTGKKKTGTEEAVPGVIDITDGVVADRVMVVPNLFGTDLGFLAGRLATNKATIADSPMRVKTGAALGLKEIPKDTDGRPLDLAVLETLDSNRFSVVQWYDDYEGLYFADGNLLDATGGDYQKIENLRPVDAVARRVRIMAIQRIADRILNNTGPSIAAHEVYFGTPLREMSVRRFEGGQEIPGLIQPPKEDDVTIQWLSNQEVQIDIQVRPYNSAKKISVGISLNTNQV